MVSFIAPLAWTTSLEATKAVEWLTVEPSSGLAGDVTMKVTAQPNLAYEDRSATVTIKSGDATASFTVKQAGKPRPIEVTEVKLDQTDLTLTEGESATLIATVSPENATNKTVTWSTSNVEVVTVDESGKVTALVAGEATITAKAGEKTAECKVKVNSTPPAPEPPSPPSPVTVSSIALDQTNLSLQPGGSATLVATVGPENADDKTVSWQSSNPAVATVDISGKVTAVAVGEAVITAKAGDKTAECKVTVNPILVSSVALNKTELVLKVGEFATLIATVGPENATDKAITWSSSNSAVVTVDAEGKVTAVAVGESVITAKAGEKTAECKVTVNPIPVSSISLDRTELQLVIGESASLVATVGPENATDKTVTWSSSNPAIAAVDANGNVTALTVGDAVVSAMAGNLTATCTVEVSVPSGSIEGTGMNQETP